MGDFSGAPIILFNPGRITYDWKVTFQIPLLCISSCLLSLTDDIEDQKALRLAWQEDPGRP